MGVVTLQTAFGTRGDSLVAGPEGMTLTAEGGDRPHFLGGVGIMTGTAFAVHRWRMADPFLPIGIHLVTIDAKGRLLLQQEGLFVVAVGVMTDRTIAMSRRRVFRHFPAGVTGNAEPVGGRGQQEGLVAGMGVMTQGTATFDEGLMPPRFLPFILNLLMTSGTELGAALDQQVFALASMRVMAGRALADHERTVQTGPPHILIDRSVAFAAQGTLVLNQDSAEVALVGFVTGHAMTFPGGFMSPAFARGDIAVAFLAKFFRRFEQHVRLARRSGVSTMTDQAVAFGCRRVRLPFGFRHLGSDILEVVAIEAELGRARLDHPGIIAGVRTMATAAGPLRRRRMHPFLGKSGLKIFMAGVAKSTAISGHGKRRVAVGTGVAITALANGNRLMDAGTEQAVAIRRMHAVAVDTIARYRIATVTLAEVLGGDLMTAGAEGIFILIQQSRKIGAVGLVAAFAAVSNGLMDILTREGFALVTGKADFVTLLLQQKLVGRIMRIMTGVAFAVRHRLMLIFHLRQVLAHLAVALKTKAGNRAVQIGAADQPVPPMTVGAVSFFDRAMNFALGEPLPIIGMAVKATFTRFIRTSRKASRQSQQQQRDQQAEPES